MSGEFELKYDEAAGLVPGTWTPLGVDNAMVTCQNDREHVATLSDHKIDENGVVTPSLVCPVEGCGFHEWVRLQGWNEPLQ